MGAYLVLFPRARIVSVVPVFFFIPLDVPAWIQEDARMNEDQIRDRCVEEMQKAYQEKVDSIE